MGRILFSFIFSLAAATGYGLGRVATVPFEGHYACDGFGLPTAAYPRLHVDRNLVVTGEWRPGRHHLVGRLQPREHGLAYFDLNKETIAWPGSPLNPFAEYIVDDARDSLLILEIQGQRATRAFVCHRH